MTALADRFAAARPRPPLSDLSDADRAELDGLLGCVGDFEDLPGRWQAALLAAEGPAGEATQTPHCCGGR